MSNKLNIRFKYDFTNVPNVIFRDKNLSYKAKGIFVQIISVAESWNFSISGLASISKESTSAVQSGIDELIARGYLEWNRSKDDTGRFNVEINVFLPGEETPQEKTTSGEIPLRNIVDNKELTNKGLILDKELTNIAKSENFAEQAKEENQPIVLFEEPVEQEIVPVKKSRKPDLLFEAVCKACYIDYKELSKSGRGQLNKLMSEFRDVGATPESVFYKANVYKVKNSVAITPRGLIFQWASLNEESVKGIVTNKQRDKALDTYNQAKALEDAWEPYKQQMVADGELDEYGNEIDQNEIEVW